MNTKTLMPNGADDRPRATVILLGVINQMKTVLRAQTRECVMETFGISMNTWTKIKNGEPVRASVADRLIRRLAEIEPAIRPDKMVVN